MIRQQFEEKGVLFPIEEKPVYTLNNAGALQFTGYRGIFKEESLEPLYIGTKYKPIHNSELIPVAEAMEDLGYKFRQVYNYKDPVFRFEFASMKVDLEVFKEPTFIKFDLFNSYNGQHALELRAGLLVQICSNGATTSKGEFKFYARHTGKMLSSLEKLPQKADSFKRLIENISWETSELPLLDRILEESKLSEKSKGILQLKWDQEYQKYGNTKFAYFMAGTYLTTHNGLPYTQKLQLEKEIDYWVLN